MEINTSGTYTTTGEFKKCLNTRLPVPSFKGIVTTQDELDSALTTSVTSSESNSTQEVAIEFSAIDTVLHSNSEDSELLFDTTTIPTTASVSTTMSLDSSQYGISVESIDGRSVRGSPALDQQSPSVGIYRSTSISSQDDIRDDTDGFERNKKTSTIRSESKSSELAVLQQKLAEMEDLLRAKTTALATLEQELLVVKSDLVESKENFSLHITAVPDVHKLILTKAALESGDMFQGKINTWLVKAGFAVISSEPTGLDTKSSHRTAAMASTKVTTNTNANLPNPSFIKSHITDTNSQVGGVAVAVGAGGGMHSNEIPITLQGVVDTFHEVGDKITNNIAVEAAEIEETLVASEARTVVAMNETRQENPLKTLLDDDSTSMDVSIMNTTDTTADEAIVATKQTAIDKKEKESSLSLAEHEFESIRMDFDDAPPWLNLDEVTGRTSDVNTTTTTSTTTYTTTAADATSAINGNGNTNNAVAVLVSNSSTISELEVQAPQQIGNPSIAASTTQVIASPPAANTSTSGAARRGSTSSFGFGRIASAIFSGFGSSIGSAAPVSAPTTVKIVEDTRDLSDPNVLVSVASELIQSSGAKVAQALTKSIVFDDDDDDDEEDLILVRYNGASQYVTANELYLLVVQEVLELRDALRKDGMHYISPGR